jgi:hypothetical protein
VSDFTWLMVHSAGGFVIDNKTISRKHLIVQVDLVEPSECASHKPVSYHYHFGADET